MCRKKKVYSRTFACKITGHSDISIGAITLNINKIVAVVRTYEVKTKFCMCHKIWVRNEDEK